MTRIQPISDQLAVGGQPGADELKALREGGFATLVNLCASTARPTSLGPRPKKEPRPRPWAWPTTTSRSR